jgi:hypothetical protein
MDRSLWIPETFWRSEEVMPWPVSNTRCSVDSTATVITEIASFTGGLLGYISARNVKEIMN